MDEATCLTKMAPPSKARAGRWLGGILQIKVTRVCDMTCCNCTQGSQLRGPIQVMTPEQFEDACRSLAGYFGVVGVFGGNGATSKHFPDYCRIARRYFPLRQLGLWCNNPMTVENAKLMRITFNPHHSVLNTHLNQKAFDMFKEGWPESKPFGNTDDSRHAPPWVAMHDLQEMQKVCPTCNGQCGTVDNDKDVAPGETFDEGWVNCPTCSGKGTVYDTDKAHELISRCDINQNWSAIIGLFRGQLRAWVCEIMAAQSELHQDDPAYPDTGIHLPLPPASTPWWTWPMTYFREQVRKHCHECSVPLRGYGELACASDEDGLEQTSATHADIFKPKRPNRKVEVVERLEQLGLGKLRTGVATEYVANGTKAS